MPPWIRPLKRLPAGRMAELTSVLMHCRYCLQSYLRSFSKRFPGVENVGWVGVSLVPLA